MKIVKAGVRRLAGWFFSLKTIRRLTLTYIFMFCIPLLALLTLHYRHLFSSVSDYYVAAQRVESARALVAAEKQRENLLSIGPELQSSAAFCEYLDGKYRQDSERVYNYNVYVLPLMDQVKQARAGVQDIEILSLAQDFRLPPYYFVEEWPEDASEMQSVVLLEKPISAVQKNHLEDAPYFTWGARLYNTGYSRVLGLLYLRVDWLDYLQGIVPVSDENRVYLLLEDRQYRLTQGGLLPVAQEDYVEPVNDVSIHLLGRSVVTTHTRLPDTNASLVFVADFSFFTSANLITLVAPFFIALVLFFSIIFVNLSMNTGRIVRFSRFLKQVDYNRLATYPHKPGNDEIDVMIGAYNTLVKNIDQLVTRVLKEEIKNREAQYYALQAQVNPHFLLNTLENIHMMAVLNDDAGTAKMVLMLGKLFQYNLNKNVLNSTVDEELLHACNYLELCSMRMGPSLNYQIVTNDWTAGALVCPRNIIQPLVENSINHAFKRQKGNKTILIDIQQQGEELCITVSDNGVGMPSHAMERLVQKLQSGASTVIKGHGVGIGNIHERLKLFYGDDYGVTLQADSAGGLATTLHMSTRQTLPIELAQKEDADDEDCAGG